MAQKKLLTADEVYQLFGVDIDALNELVQSGAVKVSDDFGTVQYLREDFVSLVNEGRLTPRTSAEMFQMDSDGDIPFLKLKNENENILDEEVSFIELDEEALNEQAATEVIGSGSPLAAELNFSRTNDSDSDVRIAEPTSSLDYSDSDVRLVSVPESANGSRSSQPKSSGMADSDSDVRIASAIKSPPDSDSDVQLVKVSPVDGDIPEATVSKLTKTGDSDSDVRLAVPGKTPPDSDSDVQLVTVPAAVVDSPIAVAQNPITSGDSDSDVRIASISQSTPDSDSDVRIASIGNDFPSSSAKTMLGASDSDVVLVNPDAASKSSNSQVDASTDSGISLVEADSGIRLSDADSGISLVGEDSGIRLDSADSGISLVGDDDSGISIENADSGISLGDADSGIRLGGDDSGISLGDTESGISLIGSDSGISVEDDVFDPSATLAEEGSQEFEIGLDSQDELDNSVHTMELPAQLPNDSGFDVSLAEEDLTSELSLDDSDGESPAFAATVISKTPSKKTPRTQSLSEAFKLDEPPEVEDLDISDDLDAAVGSGSLSEEFAEADEEAFEASDDDFAVSEVSEDDVEEMSEDDVAIPASKVRKGPREPQWGAVAVAPIILASLFMLTTITIVWGGIVTEWTGSEPPGPAGMLISTLAGLF